MRALVAAVALLLLAAAPAAAAPGLVSIGDFAAPVHVTSPPGDSRVYVVEQGGLVKIAGGGTFLDVTSLTDGGGERGLLSIAFAPDYVTSGRFFVFLTAQDDGRLRVLEFRRSANPDVADPASARELLSIPHPNASNHNGGQLQIGPDGMLYVSTGDGGADASNAQNLATELGKILRIDPNTGGPAAGNPFNTRVWAYGLRNPWRFSFDRASDDLVIGDVGQSSWEEVDWARAADGGGRGVNFGWPCFEGTHPGTGCSAPGAAGPAFERSQADGYCAITGGYVVRDPGLPTLAGRYLYGDLCLGTLRSTTLGADDDRVETTLALPRPSSFGEDGCGRVYVASLDGPVYRIQDGAASPCAGGPGPGPPVVPAADATAPGLRVTVEGLRSAVRRRQLRLRVRCTEACRVTAGGRLRGAGPLRTARRSLAAERRTIVRVRMSRATARRLRRALARRGRVVAVVNVRAQDLAGNSRRTTRRPRVRA